MAINNIVRVTRTYLELIEKLASEIFLQERVARHLGEPIVCLLELAQHRRVHFTTRLLLAAAFTLVAHLVRRFLRFSLFPLVMPMDFAGEKGRKIFFFLLCFAAGHWEFGLCRAKSSSGAVCVRARLTFRRFLFCRSPKFGSTRRRARRFLCFFESLSKFRCICLYVGVRLKKSI